MCEDCEKDGSIADQGHITLIADLAKLLGEAQAYDFHDFMSNRHDCPKVELRKKLAMLADQVMYGRYDNKPKK